MVNKGKTQSEGGVSMEKSELEKGQDIELIISWNGQTLSYKTTIFDFYNEWILIPAITARGKIIGFPEECNVDFIYTKEKGLFRWQNVSLAPVRVGKKILHRIILDGVGTPYNRRNAFRLFLGEQMGLYYSTEVGRNSTYVLVKDISETGFGFFSKEDFDMKHLVSIRLVDGTMALNLSGVIVRKQKIEGKDMYFYGCQLTHKYNILGQYIVMKQRQLMSVQSH